MTNAPLLYLDCNATTPLDSSIREAMLHYFDVDYGNAGSRTHEYGTRAKQGVQKARDQIASLIHCESDEVFFTSGATESNNLAILGMAQHAEKTGRKHIVTTQIEHKAVLEPVEELERRGFEVSRIAPTSGGWVEPSAILSALRPDTLLVSVMHANNETGVIQPLDEFLDGMKDHSAFFHTDAAQSFGKLIAPLQNPRIDLISISGHKIYGPKGIGALISRRRGYDRIPLTPLMFGGGQERGLRPGTLPVPLIVALGLAAELAGKEWKKRAEKCLAFRKELLAAFAPFNPVFNGAPELTLPHVVNFSIPGIDSEALMLALKHDLAISNGSACTSASYKPSHVLEAMGIASDAIRCSVRLSWCHLTDIQSLPHVMYLLESLAETH